MKGNKATAGQMKTEKRPNTTTTANDGGDDNDHDAIIKAINERYDDHVTKVTTYSNDDHEDVEQKKQVSKLKLKKKNDPPAIQGQEEEDGQQPPTLQRTSRRSTRRQVRPGALAVYNSGATDDEGDISILYDVEGDDEDYDYEATTAAVVNGTTRGTTTIKRGFVKRIVGDIAEFDFATDIWTESSSSSSPSSSSSSSSSLSSSL